MSAIAPDDHCLLVRARTCLALAREEAHMAWWRAYIDGLVLAMQGRGHEAEGHPSITLPPLARDPLRAVRRDGLLAGANRRVAEPPEAACAILRRRHRF